MAPENDEAQRKDGVVEEIEVSEASCETEATDVGGLRFPPSGTKGWG